MRLATENRDKLRSWLVKSGDRIIGPFSIAEINQNLVAKELVAIDEVALPGGRWRFIREEPAFAPVLEEIRSAMLNAHEDTEVGSASSKTPVAEAREDKSDMPTQPNIKLSSLQAVEVAQRTSVERPPALDGTGHPLLEKKPARGIAPVARTTAWAAGAALVILAGLFAIRQLGTGPTVQPSSFETVYRDGLEAYRFGRFDEALRKFAEADALRPNVPDLSIHYAALLARAGQTELAKQKSEAFISSPNPSIRRDALVIHSAVLLADGSNAAARNDLEDALSLNPGDAIVLVNSGVASVGRGARQKGLEKLRQAVKSDPNSAPAALILAQALAQADSGIAEAVEIVRATVAKTADYRQEGYFLLSRYFALIGETSEARAQLLDALRTDPFATESHWHEPTLDLSLISWSQALLPMCRTQTRDMTREAPKEVAGRAMLALCQEKAGQDLEAKTTAVDLVRRAPKEPLSSVILAYVLLRQNEDAEADAALKIASEQLLALKQNHSAPAAGDPLERATAELATLLRAHLCWKQKDIVCAKAEFEKLAGQKSPPIFATVALAHIQMMQKKRIGAAPDAALISALRPILDSVRQGSPGFIPLMELEAALEPKK